MNSCTAASIIIVPDTKEEAIGNIAILTGYDQGSSTHILFPRLVVPIRTAIKIPQIPTPIEVPIPHKKLIHK